MQAQDREVPFVRTLGRKITGKISHRLTPRTDRVLRKVRTQSDASQFQQAEGGMVGGETCEPEEEKM